VITGEVPGLALGLYKVGNGESLLAASVRWDKQIARKHPPTEMAMEKNRMHVPPAKSSGLVKKLETGTGTS
jgi:hypothetical protein